MDIEIDQELEKVQSLAQSKHYDEAEQLLAKLCQLYPGCPRVYSDQAYVYSRRGNEEQAIVAISKAISINSEEPAYFFKRGRYYLRSGKYQNAIDDFSRVLELGRRYDSKYFEMEAYFLRAEAFLRLGNFEKAKADCAHVDDGFDFWIDGLRSKEDILADCRK